MSLADGFTWQHGDWQFVGYSLAGITTSVVFRNAQLCFDVGQGLPFQNSVKHLLITHAHVDHAGGVPYLLAQKAMLGQRESNVYVPPAFAGPLREIIEIWRRVDEHDYDYRLVAAEPGELYELGAHYCARPFATVHRVPSQGYVVYQKRKRLRPELEGAGREAILALKARGDDPNESVLEPIVAFTGDTQIEGLAAHPDVARARILFVEATFWDPEKPVEHARRWGHIHLDELIDWLPRLQNERIVLIHASVRYPTGTLERILRQRLPAAERERVVIFPRPL